LKACVSAETQSCADNFAENFRQARKQHFVQYCFYYGVLKKRPNIGTCFLPTCQNSRSSYLHTTVLYLYVITFGSQVIWQYKIQSTALNGWHVSPRDGWHVSPRTHSLQPPRHGAHWQQSSRDFSQQRWCSTERELHRLAAPCGRTVRFSAVSKRRNPSNQYGADGERVAPLRGRTGVNPLHTMRPRPPLRSPAVCVRVTQMTSEGIHWASGTYVFFFCLLIVLTETKTTSRDRRRCLSVHCHVSCPRTHWCAHSWRQKPQGKRAHIPNEEGARKQSIMSPGVG
jgi:hypothetical protein